MSPEVGPLPNAASDLMSSRPLDPADQAGCAYVGACPRAGQPGGHRAGGGGIGTTFVGITTAGDLDQRQLTEIGGTGVFVSAVRDALRRGEIDVAVHSLKDLPTTPAEDLEIIAIPAREDTRDVLVGRRLDDLSDGARVGTGAPRRAMQIIDWAAGRDLRLEVVPIRGNVETRIERAREGEGRRGDLGRGRVAPAQPVTRDGCGPRRHRRQAAPSTDS